MNSKKARDVPVVSPKTLQHIKTALDQSLNEIIVSLNLNISKEKILLNPHEYTFDLPNGERISFPKSFNLKEKVCYAIFENNIHPMKFYNEETNLFYKLVPTSYRPILRISATQMHKRPFIDYIESLELEGRILDGGTGLGYSAIIASLTATQVITVEWDPNVIEMASFNPHSSLLFKSSKIELREADITEEILSFEDQVFDNIIQDGGTPKSSGTFFSQSYSNELFRVLKPYSSLFFYLPQHGVSKGRDFGLEHIERLQKAGFILKRRDINGSYAHLIKDGY
ncbi:MAG: methyltransferase domain-containing protein [Candidatus Hodarchaeales archaeon]|jgi:predicted methyltransferase